MTQHNITGSEAFRPSPHILVRLGRRGRAVSPVVWFHVGAAAAGGAAGVIDLSIGQPVAVVVCVLGLAAWRMWPAR